MSILKSSIFTCAFWGLFNLATGQALHYDVVKGDKVIGSMDVVRSWEGRMETISMHSDVRYRIIMELVVLYSLEEQFYQGVLQSGNGISTLNKSVQHEFEIKKNAYNYTIIYGDVPSNIDYESIEYTATKLYFEEPTNGRPMFSQHFGKYLTFEKLSSHYYRLLSPEGKNYYKYEKGICTEVKVMRDYGTIYFKLKPESYVIVNKPDSLRNK